MAAWPIIEMKGKAAAKPKTKAPKTKKEKAVGPKKPKSAFIFFSQERRLTLKVERPELGITDASKILGKEWRELTDADKQRFNELAVTDRARYAREKGELASASD
jgi:hypothetical protein